MKNTEVTTQDNASNNKQVNLFVETSFGEMEVKVSICSIREAHKIEVLVLLNDTEAGWRCKDGAEDKRNQVKGEVAASLGVLPATIRLQARYSRLQPTGDGMAKDMNTGGYVILK